jgi:hypothetical protein
LPFSITLILLLYVRAALAHSYRIAAVYGDAFFRCSYICPGNSQDNNLRRPKENNTKKKKKKKNRMNTREDPSKQRQDRALSVARPPSSKQSQPKRERFHQFDIRTRKDAQDLFLVFLQIVDEERIRADAQRNRPTATSFVETTVRNQQGGGFAGTPTCPSMPLQ